MNNKLIVASLLILATSSCEESSKKASSVWKSISGGEIDSPSKDLTENDAANKRKISDKDDLAEEEGDENTVVTVAASDWKLINSQYQKCVSDSKAFKLEHDTLIEETYNKGKRECRSEVLSSQEGSIKKIYQELGKNIDEAVTMLSRYRKTSALITMQCEASMENGEVWLYDVQPSKCINVTSIEVSPSTGEITAVKGVSSEAMQYGIMQFYCSIGQANFKLQDGTCEYGVVESEVNKEKENNKNDKKGSEPLKEEKKDSK